VARKKSKKRSWAKTLLIYLCIPIGTWFIAFLLWFYWHDLTGTTAHDKERATPASKVNRGESRPAKRQQENIFDEDRKRLDDILKRRG
jgi:hypothetical protein